MYSISSIKNRIKNVKIPKKNNFANDKKEEVIKSIDRKTFGFENVRSDFFRNRSMRESDETSVVSKIKKIKFPKLDIVSKKELILKNKLISFFIVIILILLITNAVFLVNYLRSKNKQPNNVANVDELSTLFKDNNNVVVSSGEFDIQPLGKGKHIKVNDDMIKVFEYKDSSEALQMVRSISADGTEIKGGKIIWDFPPHFYSKDRVIALYLGTNEKTLDELEKIFGKQFAGAK